MIRPAWRIGAGCRAQEQSGANLEQPIEPAFERAISSPGADAADDYGARVTIEEAVRWEALARASQDELASEILLALGPNPTIQQKARVYTWAGTAALGNGCDFGN